MSGAIGFSVFILIAQIASIEEMRFRWVSEQSYDFSCGIAAVSSLASLYWHTETSESAILDTFGEREEISMLDLAAILEGLGFATRGYRLKYANLVAAAEKHGPLIVHLADRSGHFALFIGTIDGMPVIGDPSDGLTVWPEGIFLESWSGVTLVAAHLDRALDTISVENAKTQVESRMNLLSAWSLE